MTPLASSIIAGLAAGLVAALAMSLFQQASAHAFGQDGGDDDPATVKAAVSAKEAAVGRPVKPPRREAAGSGVHYATGAALGIAYAVLVLHWPPAATGFGVAFGIAVALVLDDLLVPAFGWGSWPWQTALATHGYSITSHIVFGAVLEGVRRLGLALLG